MDFGDLFKVVLGLLIIPKWLGLRTYPNILLDDFGTSKNRQNVDPQTSYSLPKYLKKTRKNRNIFQNIIVVNLEKWTDNFGKDGHRQHPTIRLVKS